MNNLSLKNDAYYSADRRDMLKYVDFPVQSILDVGCGEGNFAFNFPGADYWGVEPASKQANIAASKNLKILNGTYEDVSGQIPNGHFDLITCNDVIEHMSDPIGFLTEIKQKLKPDGKLIASIPNIRYIAIVLKLLMHGEFDYEQSGIMDYTHLHFFTPRSFSKMVKNIGWKIEVIEPLTVAPFKPIKNLILKFLERNSQDLRTIQFAVRMSPINPLNDKESYQYQ